MIKNKSIFKYLLLIITTFTIGALVGNTKVLADGNITPVSLETGDKYNIRWNALNIGSNLDCSSDNESVATVKFNNYHIYSSRDIIAVSAGTAKIECSKNSEVVSIYNVTVTQKDEAITERKNVTVYMGSTQDLGISSDANCSYNDDAIASISNTGTLKSVTGNAIGTTTATCYYGNDETIYNITVKGEQACYYKSNNWVWMSSSSAANSNWTKTSLNKEECTIANKYCPDGFKNDGYSCYKPSTTVPVTKGEKTTGKDSTNCPVGYKYNGSTCSPEAGTSGGDVPPIDKGDDSTTEISTLNYDEGTCNDFSVKRVHRYKQDPFASDGQAFNVYDATATCSTSNSTQYIAFCINPELQGVINATPYHSREVLDLTTKFGQYMFTLYHIYRENGGCSETDYACRARYQAAARILQYDTGEYINQSLLATDWQTNAFNNWSTGNISGSEYGNAQTIAKQVKDTYTSTSANGGNISIRVSQLGDTEYQGGSTFTAKYNIVLENTNGYSGIQTPTIVWKSGENVVSGYSAAISDPTIDGDTRTYTLTISGNINTADCSGYTMEVHVNYDNLNDITAARIIEPTNGRTTQKFVIFEVGTTGEKVAAAYVNPGNTSCQSEATSCTTTSLLTCTDDEYQEIVVNEGVQPGTTQAVGEQDKTDWEACIIGKTDEQGNSYDIQEQNTETFIGTEDTGEYSDNILATLISGTKITNSTYCTISCKEQYTFKLPGGKKDIKQGTYFSFDIAGGNPRYAVAGVTSERKCVSSGQDVSGSNTNNVDYETYEKIVLDLRKQEVDYLNAYLYYKAIYDAMDKEENQNQYINDTKQDFHLDYGGHYSDRNGGSDSDFMNKTYNVGDASWNTAYTPKFNLEGLIQYKIVDPNSTTSEIIKVENIGATSEKSFEETAKGNSLMTEYNTAAQYNNIYEETYQIFEKNAYINENSKTDSGTYSYEYKVCGKFDYDLKECAYYNKETGDDQLTAKYNLDGRDNKLSVYNTVKENMKVYAQSALDKYNALSSQIDSQVSSMTVCSGYLDSATQAYNFDPNITFTYDQDNYMQMLSASTLTLASSSKPTLNTTLYYCTGSVANAADVFNCSTTAPHAINFEYMSAIEYGDDPGDAKPVPYYQVTRIGSKATYTCNGTYCYYRSQTPFYTYPADGIATNDGTVENSTVINPYEDTTNSNKDDQGYVYPVTITTVAGVHNYKLSFKQIGQYSETGYLGRIMGGNGGKIGTRNGEEQDYEACYYDVCPTTDPDCGNNNTNEACAQIVTKSCNNGNVTSMTVDDYANCITQLISNNDCCDEATSLANQSSGSLPPDVVTKYNAACSDASTCKSFTIYNSTDNLYDVANVDNSGELQFTVRSVSLNNLFPNTKGINWETGTGSAAASEIKENGESIYGNDPDYEVTLTPTCIAAIKEYNATQDESGGLTDYTGTISTSSEYKAGSASYSTFLNKLNDMGCIYSGTKINNIDAIE